MSKEMRNKTRVCDQSTPRDIASAKQREIAELAYQLWIARGFRHGSPQEDWLRAQQTLCRQPLRA